MTDKTFKYENLTLTEVGSVPQGIDGSDQYVAIQSDDWEPLDAEKIDQLFWEKWRCETTCEAGGYFCKSYSLFIDKHDDSRAVLCIQHRYDI